METIHSLDQREGKTRERSLREIKKEERNAFC